MRVLLAGEQLGQSFRNLVKLKKKTLKKEKKKRRRQFAMNPALSSKCVEKVPDAKG